MGRSVPKQSFACNSNFAKRCLMVWDPRHCAITRAPLAARAIAMDCASPDSDGVSILRITISDGMVMTYPAPQTMPSKTMLSVAIMFTSPAAKLGPTKRMNVRRLLAGVA